MKHYTEQCFRCGGTGKIPVLQDLSLEVTGAYNLTRCYRCSGKGFERKPYTFFRRLG